MIIKRRKLVLNQLILLLKAIFALDSNPITNNGQRNWTSCQFDPMVDRG